MIGLDSYILIRYLAQDDPLQSKKANQIVDRALEAGQALYLNHIVVCESCGVLARLYGYHATEIAAVMEKLLSAAQFEFEDKDSLWQALAAYRNSNADFADCLIGVKNAAAGCASTFTYDRSTGKLAQFSLA